MKSKRLSLSAVTLLAFAPLRGAEGEEGGTEGSGGTGSGGNGGEGEGGSATGANSTGDEGGDPQKKISALEEEKNRHYNKAQEAEARANELQKELEKRDREKLTEQERVQKDLETVTGERDALQSQVEALLIQNAFLTTNDVQWHNTERALRSVDLSDVKINDGKVDTKALKDAIKKLATDEPYMVKTAEGGGSTPPPPRSGQPGAGKGTKGSPDKERLMKKYPSLRQHA